MTGPLVFNFSHGGRELQTKKIRLVILNLSIIFKLGCGYKAGLPVTKVFKTQNSFNLIPKHLYSLSTVRSKSEHNANSDRRRNVDHLVI